VAFELLALEQAIDEFDPVAFGNNNPEEVRKMVALSARVEKLPVYVKGEVSTKWRRRLSGEGPTMKEAFVSSGLKVINEVVASKRAEFFDDNVVKDGKEADFAAFEMEITQMANQLKRLMPDNPTPEQAAQIINQVTSVATNPQLKERFAPIKVPEPQTPGPFQRPIPAKGVEPAMPMGSGGMNPILFQTR
jgi:hypothetical protein